MPTAPDALSLTLGLLAFASLLAAGLWAPTAWRAWRHRRIAARPFPAAWRSVLRRRMPLMQALPPDLQLQLKRRILVFLAEKPFIGAHGLEVTDEMRALMQALPPDLQLQLKRRILVFLAEKPFIGAHGLEVTDEMRVLVAAQACLLTLNRPGEHFAGLRQILLYPSAYWVDRREADGTGVQHERREARAGESWVQGQVILSWPDVLAGAAHAHDGENLVIHEFAHQLDQARGRATGAPYLGERRRYARWAAVMGREFATLRARVAADEPTLLSPYAATEPAEFFAVASEVFFERPHDMAREHPALYAELARYYAVHPLAWH